LGDVVKLCSQYPMIFGSIATAKDVCHIALVQDTSELTAVFRFRVIDKIQRKILIRLRFLLIICRYQV